MECGLIKQMGPMMYDPDKGTYKLKPMKIGDDIMNSDRCPPGKKFNLKIGKCIPMNAMVGMDGIVTVAAGDYRSPGENLPPQPPEASQPPAGDAPPADAAIQAEGAKRAKAKILGKK